MNGREKMEAAMSSEGAGELPAVICYEGIYVRDHWHALTPRPWWHNSSPELCLCLGCHLDMLSNIRQDWMVLPNFYTREARKQIRIEFDGGEAVLADDRDGSRSKIGEPVVSGSDGHNGHSFRPSVLAESREQIDELIGLPPEIPASVSDDGRSDLALSILASEPGKQRYPFRHGAYSPFWGCYGVWGFEGLMIMVATLPDLVKYACGRHLEVSIRNIDQAAAMGARGIWIEECFTDMVSPDAYRELNYPYIRQITDHIRFKGMQSIYYYCGDYSKKLDMILSSGADAVSFEEGKKGFVIDIEILAEHINGRCALFGNLDAIGVLQNGSEEDLRMEIRRQLKAGRRNKNRFIMSLGSPVTPLTSKERVNMYLDMAHEMKV